MEPITLLLSPDAVARLKALHDARHGPVGTAPLAGCTDVVLLGLAEVCQGLAEPIAERYKKNLENLR